MAKLAFAAADFVEDRTLTARLQLSAVYLECFTGTRPNEKKS